MSFRLTNLGIILAILCYLTPFNIADDTKILPQDCQPDTHYLCRDGVKCIIKRYICNGVEDCPDKDDEAHCSDDQKCDENKFMCKDGVKCIPKELTCDNVADCPDASDESDSLCEGTILHIPNRVCDLTKEFECEAKICIKKSLTCDGVKHCFDGRDEDPELCKDKKLNTTCPGYLCNNKQCLPVASWACDGFKDCADGSDELHCSPHCDMTNGKFLCKDGECIDVNKACDGSKDCSDGSDEGGSCNQKSDCDVLKCTGPCKILPSGASCLCKDGTEFDEKTKKCGDANECLTYGICSQGCVNTNGSHYCTCAKSFLLSNDKKSCVSYGDNPILVYTTQNRVKTIHLRAGKEQVWSEIISKTKQAIGVTYDGQNYYWTDVSDGKEAIVKFTPGAKKKEPLFTAGLEAPEDITVDWLTGNLYFTDADLAHVAVCEKEGIHCTILVSSEALDKPRSIALHPSESLMFWTDWGKTAHIGVAYMDGSNSKVLVNNVMWPNGLTLDWPNGRIYWVDARIQTIESATITGKDRRIVLKDIVKHPFGIAVFENQIFWSDWETLAIESCDKFTGKDHEILVQGEQIYDVHIYHKAMMPYQRHACENHKCSHICLLGFNSTYTCACPENMELTADKHTCWQSGKVYSFIMGIANYIAVVPQQTFGRHVNSLAFSTPYNVDQMEYNSLNGQIFTADSQAGIIAMNDVKEKKSKVLVNQHVLSVTSLAFDYLANNLYWIDYMKNTIEVYSLDNKKRTIVQHFSGTDRPTAFALVPSLGEIIVAFESNDTFHIDKLSMHGDNNHHFHVIETDLSKKGPINIAVDETSNVVFWSDGEAKRIESSSFSGLNRKTFITTSRSPSSLAIINNEIYWTSSKSKTLQWCKKNDSSLIKQSSMEKPPGMKKMPDMINVIAGTPLIFSNHPCKVNNGNCSDICISDGKFSRVCLCETGHFFKDKTNTQCVKRLECDFKCSNSGECLEKSQRCDGKMDCKDGSDEKDCIDGRTCDVTEFMCKDGKQCIKLSQRCDQSFNCNDRSDELNCTVSEKVIHCKDKQMRCPSGICLDVTQRCDGVDDCGDGFDERPELCQTLDCPKEFFKCISGQCIPNRFECNSFIDCVDASDEHDNCTIQMCRPNMRACPSGWCISISMMCDGHEDCPDGFDERSCPPPGAKALNETCDDDEYQCPSDESICLKQTEICDEKADCPKGEDEKKCPKCRRDQFECANDHCISNKWICDGHDDCEDNSDELNCGKPQGIVDNHNCASDQFKCADGSCLSNAKVCDGNLDCNGGDDEGGLCDTACKVNNCDQMCQKTPKGSVCSCKNGYELRNGKSCFDIDECKTKNVCSQKCENTIGSFRCSCFHDFILSSDKTTCKALEGSDMELIFTFDEHIRKFTDPPKAMQLLVDTLDGRISDVDVDMDRQKILYSVWGSSELVEVDLISGNMTESFDSAPSSSRIAHDWISGNTYVVHFPDDMRVEIHACNILSKTCAIVKKFNHNEKVPSIQVDPINKFLFFVQLTEFHVIQPTSKVFRTRLDGSDPQIILNDTHVTAMALDIDKEKIYVTEVETQSLQEMSYDGSDRKILTKQNRMLKRPISMSLFENHAYILNEANAQLTQCKLYDDLVCRQIGINVNNAKRIVIAQQSRQKDGENHCENHSCDVICIAFDLGHKCLCQNGTLLRPGERCNELLMISSITESSNGGVSWWWTFIILFLIAAMVAAVLFMYRRKSKHGRFNVSMYFRNELSNLHDSKPVPLPRESTSVCHQPVPTAPIVKAINQNSHEFCPSETTVTVNSTEVSGFSDDETHEMDDVDFNNDPHQRLIL